MDQNGKLLQADRICWSEAPTVVSVQKPYAIALLPRARRVEVKFEEEDIPIWISYQLFMFTFFSFTDPVSSSSISINTDCCPSKYPPSY